MWAELLRNPGIPTVVVGRRALIIGASGFVLAQLGLGDAGVATAQPTPPRFRLLAFSRTTGFRHDSIPAAIAAVQALGTQNGFAVDATEDPSVFTDAGLSKYAAVVFLLTTGNVVERPQRDALERFIAAGRGFVGVHSAADTEYDWSWYGGLMGAYFASHPDIQQATVHIDDADHPSTTSLPDPWVRMDEWYNFRTDPRSDPDIHILASLDESTYSGGTMGDHPIAWYHAYLGGRAWYTAGGHTSESYSEPLFLAHLLGGIEYAAGAVS
jgi:type 1 glutamine amidotransferase